MGAVGPVAVGAVGGGERSPLAQKTTCMPSGPCTAPKPMHSHGNVVHLSGQVTQAIKVEHAGCRPAIPLVRPAPRSLCQVLDARRTQHRTPSTPRHWPRCSTAHRHQECRASHRHRHQLAAWATRRPRRGWGQHQTWNDKAFPRKYEHTLTNCKSSQKSMVTYYGVDGCGPYGRCAWE
jgi:hypothetical protein